MSAEVGGLMGVNGGSNLYEARDEDNGVGEMSMELSETCHTARGWRWRSFC